MSSWLFLFTFSLNSDSQNGEREPDSCLVVNLALLHHCRGPKEHHCISPLPIQTYDGDTML